MIKDMIKRFINRKKIEQVGVIQRQLELLGYASLTKKERETSTESLERDIRRLMKEMK